MVRVDTYSHTSTSISVVQSMGGLIIGESIKWVITDKHTKEKAIISWWFSGVLAQRCRSSGAHASMRLWIESLPSNTHGSLHSICLAYCISLVFCHWYKKFYSASGEISPRSYELTALTADNVSSPPYSERESIVSYNNHISTRESSECRYTDIKEVVNDASRGCQ